MERRELGFVRRKAWRDNPAAASFCGQPVVGRLVELRLADVVGLWEPVVGRLVELRSADVAGLEPPVTGHSSRAPPPGP